VPPHVVAWWEDAVPVMWTNLNAFAIVAQVVRPDAVGATQGLLGWISYMGAACAGAPLAYMVQKLGWSVYFFVMIVAAAIACVLVLPMVNLKSYTQSSA
jgi:MFS transporter, OPA family, sugar phosphate sensor protein UhpC